MNQGNYNRTNSQTNEHIFMIILIFMVAQIQRHQIVCLSPF